MRTTPAIQKFTTPWTLDAESGLLFRLRAGTLQVAEAQADNATPVANTVTEAYEASALSRIGLNAEALGWIGRNLNSGFRDLWRRLPHATAVVVPRDYVGLGALLVTAALFDAQSETGLPEPVTDFQSERADDDEEDPDILLKLIRRAVTSWRLNHPGELEEEEALDTVALYEQLSGPAPPPGLHEELQRHGILHLDFTPRFEGHWDGDVELTLDD